jgi:class 3 adenylate cyclase
VQPWVWVSAGVAVVTAVVGVMWWAVVRVAEAKIERAEAKADKAIAEAEARAGKAEAEAAKAEVIVQRQLLTDLRDRLPVTSAASLTIASTLQQEIESTLGYLMHMIGATESSVLVPDPDPSSFNLFFLAVHGSAAGELRSVMVGPDCIAGKVLRTGQPLKVENPYGNPDFSDRVDQRLSHVTREMLTIPLVVGQHAVGVAQFLNKQNGEGFTEKDEATVVGEGGRLSLKVAEFVRDADNYVQLGLSSSPVSSSAAVMFCDLSASSSLFSVLHEPGAISCINEYLSQTVDIVLDAGGSVEQYLGDGAMFIFDQEQNVTAETVVLRAVRAAMESTKAFRRIKQSWLRAHWEVGQVFSRFGISYGSYRETLLGSSRYRRRAILGHGVHFAATICDALPRDRNIVAVDRSLVPFIDTTWTLSSPQQVQSGKLAGHEYFDVLERP